MTDFDLDWNDREILAAMEPAFNKANEVLGRKFQQEISSPKWSWPLSDPSPRDIVDLGQLRDSYDAQPGKDGQNPIHDHTWATEYAMAVHEGAKFKDPNRPPLPARRWTKAPIDDDVLEKAFEKYGGDALGKIK